MLIKLPEDVVVEILCLLDVKNVLRVERTCKQLQSTVNSRYLWLRHLNALSDSQAPDLPPHIPISSLSTPSIRSLVLRAERGYHNWHSPKGPKITRKLVVDLPIAKDWGCPREHYVAARLLPGNGDKESGSSSGRWVFAHADCGHMGVWDIREGRWRWVYRTKIVHGGFVFGDTSCVFLDDKTLLVSFCEDSQGLMSLKLLRVDMSRENSYEVYDQEVPYPELFRGECRWTRASEDVVMLYTSDYALIWMWKENARIVVRQSGQGYLECAEFIRGQLLCMRIVDDDRLGRFACLSVISVRKMFKCFGGSTAAVLFDDLPCESNITFDVPEDYTFSSVDDMSVHVANWKPDRPTTVSVVLSCVKRWHNALIAYRLSLKTDSSTEPSDAATSSNIKLGLLAQSEPCRMLPRRYNFIPHSRSGRMLVHTRSLLSDDPDLHVLAHSTDRIWGQVWPPSPTKFKPGEMSMWNGNDSSGFEYYSGAVCCLYVHTFVVAYYD